MSPVDPMPQKDYEQLIQVALPFRQGEDAEKKKGILFYLFETPGGSTAMTVLIGGIIAMLINSCIQKSINDRQAEQNRLSAKYGVQLEMQKERFKERATSNKEMVELIGQVVSHTQNLAMTHGPVYQFDPMRHQEADKEKLRKQISEIRRTFNDTHTVWNKQKDAFQYKISLYYGGDKEASEAWAKLAVAVDGYLDWVPGLDFRPAEFQEFSKKEAEIRTLMQQLSVSLTKASEKEILTIR